MRIRPLAAVAAAIAVGVLSVAAPGPASADAAGPRLMADGTGGHFAAVPTRDGTLATRLAPPEEPPPFECLWGWTTEVGGFYPEAWLRYAATFECGEDFGVGPDVAGTIQGSLHAAPGGLTLHTGPDEGFLFCCEVESPPAASGGEITLTGPGSFYLTSDSIVDLLPPLEPDDPIWVWTYLPAGCEGVGSPRAVCVIDSTPFDIT